MVILSPRSFRCFFNSLFLNIQFSRYELRVDLSKLNKVLTCVFRMVPKYRFLRKEVIQPQVLLRLPCYDFTLIICPTLDG